MNTHIQKILRDGSDIRKQTVAWYKELSRTKQVLVLVVVFVVLTILVRSFGTSPTAVELAKKDRIVKLALVSDLSNNESSLPLLGTVTSVSEATLRSESSGKLTRVYKKLGDYVSAGQVIAEFENSAERAQVLQAEGMFESAKVARDISRINNTSTNTSLNDAKTGALNTISSAYTTMDDLVRTKTDSIFTDPRFQSIRLTLSVPDSALVYTIEEKRKNIEAMLVARESKNKTLSESSNLVSELATIQSEAQIVKGYLDDLATAYSKALVNTSYSQANIDAGKGTVAAARSTIVGTVSALNSSKTALSASLSASEVATKTSDPRSTDITASDAQVKQAQGAYNAALSRLEKTIVRSPINGTINSLSIETGDFISAFTEVAVVSNNGALEVVSYVTEEEAKRIAVGNNVVIDTDVDGVVTRVAQAIDPKTRKMEVRIGITSKVSTLINGQSVRIEITRTKTSQKEVKGTVKIPLSALKLTPSGSFVFSVSATNTLIALPVTEGAILGEEIQILSGLIGDEEIVVDARGLKAGQVVSVTSQ